MASCIVAFPDFFAPCGFLSGSSRPDGPRTIAVARKQSFPHRGSDQWVGRHPRKVPTESIFVKLSLEVLTVWKSLRALTAGECHTIKIKLKPPPKHAARAKVEARFAGRSRVSFERGIWRGAMNRTAIRFCPGCGIEGVQWVSEKQISCPRCGFNLFLSVAAAIAVIVECQGRVLLTVRRNDPGKDMLDLPGGFIDPGETLEAGVARELQEELGHRFEHFEYIHSFPNQYVYKGILYNTCDMFMLIRLDSVPPLTANDDVKDLVWVDKKEVDYSAIAFDSIRRGLRHYIENHRPV
jgi:ADP-ribose pyrophosphatase YjhB (NUDIX family)